MNYTLNKTETRTSKNYKINDITIDLDLPKVEKINFNNVKISCEDFENVDMMQNFFVRKNVLSNKISLELLPNYTLDVRVLKNQKILTPTIIEFDFDEDNKVLVDNLKFVFENNSSANFIVKYKAEEDIDCFHLLKQELIAKENSSGNLTFLNLLPNKAKSFMAFENVIYKNAEISHNIIDLGGVNKISNYYSKLIGENSKNIVKTVYLGNNNDIIDINYNIEMYAKKSHSEIEVQGALNSNAKKNFKGTIDYKENSTDSVGKENENCIILSKNAKSKSLPMLLCHEENVVGEHGVSTGKIDDDRLFYIMSRGISEKEAKKLIVKANFSNIINGIESEETKNEIIAIIDKFE